MAGQRFIARERFDYPNGAIGWRPGGPSDCLGPYAHATEDEAYDYLIEYYDDSDSDVDNDSE